MRSSFLCSVSLAVMLCASPAIAAELTLTPPKLDYAKICKQEVLPVPDGTPDDKLDAKRLLQRGMFYLDGNVDIPADEERAIAIFTKLSKTNSPASYKAKWQLGKAVLRREKTTSQERKAAIAMLEETLRHGVSAFYYLGTAYEKEGDYAKAAEYYRRSATEGTAAAAAVALAQLYIDGHALPATETDPKSAAEKMLTWAQSLLLEALGKGDCSALPGIADMYYSTQSGMQNREVAAPWLQAGADAGYTSPMIRLAYLYSHGIGVELNPERAFALWKKTSEVRHPVGMYLLGLAYLNGDGTEKNLEEAAKWFAESARRGYALSAELLADIYEGKHGGAVDQEKAFYWLQQSSAAKDASAMLFFRLAEKYEYGIGTEPNHEQAFTFYKQAAEAGYNAARVKLGDAYRYGIGVEAEPIKSYRFYRLAASQKNKEAMISLAENYTCGIGKEPSADWAQRWKEKAMNAGSATALTSAMEDALAKQEEAAIQEIAGMMLRAARDGSREVMVQLGKLYSEGKAFPKDKDEAQQWFDRAISPGKDLEQGMLALAEYYIAAGERKEDGLKLLEDAIALNSDEARYHLAKQDAAQAKALLTQAANNNHAPSMMKLANMVKDTDAKTAEAWLVKAAGHHKLSAMFKLAEGYHKGTWGAVDEAKAAEWMEKAIRHLPCAPEDRTKLAMAYVNGIGVKQDSAKALAMLEDAVEGGDTATMLTIAHLYLYNTGSFNPNIDKAMHWLKKAAEAGNVEAMMELSNAYSVGLGGKQDADAAKHWLEEAAKHGDVKASLLLKTENTGKASGSAR